MPYEGHDLAAPQAHREMARLTGGAYAPFDVGAPQALTELLRAAAADAAAPWST